MPCSLEWSRVKPHYSVGSQSDFVKKKKKKGIREFSRKCYCFKLVGKPLQFLSYCLIAVSRYCASQSLQKPPPISTRLTAQSLQKPPPISCFWLLLADFLYAVLHREHRPGGLPCSKPMAWIVTHLSPLFLINQWRAALSMWCACVPACSFARVFWVPCFMRQSFLLWWAPLTPYRYPIATPW